MDRNGGDARPGGRVVLGGVERQVGGWAGYEIDRRACHPGPVRHGGGGGSYPGRTFIGGLDAAASILAAGPTGTGSESALVLVAFRKLDAALQRLEDAAGTPDWWDTHDQVGLPVVDIQGVIRRAQQTGYATPEHLEAVLRAAESIAAMPWVSPGEPKAPALAYIHEALAEARAERAALQQGSGPVATGDATGVRRLEESCRTYAEAAERCAGYAAAYIESVAAALDKSILG